ncbi:MAG: adenylate/guanylate cyclase domain-containing protein [Proteobacteria bacterium]|nr:adenylate/guanylate cyclase domain-containing protein [Pseudomonadota bacterium]
MTAEPPQTAGQAAIMAEFERASLRWAFLARPVLAGIMAVILFACFGWSSGLSALLIGAGVTALGWLAWKAGDGRWGQAARYGLVAAEIVLMTLAIFFGDLFDGNPRPPAAMLFFSPAVLFLLCILALNAITARPAIVWWSGACLFAAWFTAGQLALREPGTVTKNSLNETPISFINFLEIVTRPRFFNLDVFTLELTAIACCTVALALAAWRTRALARRAADQHAVRSGLAAHFSAPVVEALLAARAAQARTRRTLTVIDCDLVGFSGRARVMAPDAVARGLRVYHGFVEGLVFEYGGGVLKFTGDGVSAVFGMTGDAESAASAAIACAERLVAAWPEASARAFPEDPPALAVGVDAGETAAGLAGEGRAMSLVVAGPPVDGAQALQAATRQEGVGLLVSAPAVKLAIQADAAAGRGLAPRNVGGRPAFAPTGDA